MEPEQRIQLVGMALLRGLVSESALRKVVDSQQDILEALQAQGTLDAEDLQDLSRLLEAELQGQGRTPEESDLPTSPIRLEKGEGPWDSLPVAGNETDGTGRQVLRVLALATWKHYRNLRFVAEGGMGRVFKAYDPTLKRVVALKFLRREDPELLRRFTLEAQNQAKVEHPNICKVFEVGDWQGQSYIAMQFIKGLTLEAAASGLSLSDKVKVMEAVAEAVHAAHRQGLIHRDLKPANIMVVAGERGPEPTILDFGLAKGLEATGMTVQGQVIGTHHYMAPEQAKGDHDKVGRRTDVYGLGATLHKVLTGQAPFAGTEGVDVIRRTLEEDLSSLTRLSPGLSEDLDTIVRKCMEKDPARRYESALAVAEDLRRWREGEPILARKPTLIYRAGKWTRKHRLVVAVVGVAAAGLLVAGSYAGYMGYTSSARARYAQHFGQEAERIEALLRYAHLMPLHDVRLEHVQARGRMAALIVEARRAGPLAEGPAAYALGRSYLALGEVEQAMSQLQAAWDGGLRSPEVALALGRTLGVRYRLERERARGLPSGEQREARFKELDRTLRAQALGRLHEGASAALEAPSFHQALLESYAGNFDQARIRAREALEQTPWLFEARRLEGEMLLEKALGIRDPRKAIPLLQEASEVLEGARRLGPSDPATVLAELRVCKELVSCEIQSGKEGTDALARCREAAHRAQILDPDGAEAPARLAQTLISWANLRPPEHPGVQVAFQEALALSGEAIRRAPKSAETLATRISVLLGQGANRAKSSKESLESFREAQELARKGRERHPEDPLFALLMAAACRRRMTWEMNNGVPPWASFEEGLNQNLAFLERYPEAPTSYNEVGSLWVERAEYERIHGLDPRPSVDWALRILGWIEARGLVERNPGWIHGDALLIRGQYLLALGQEGEVDLRGAAEWYQRARAANPNLALAGNSIAEAMIWAARGAMEQGRDPEKELAEAEAELRRLSPQSPLPQETFFLQGMLELVRGMRQAAKGRDPAIAWSRAEGVFRLSLAKKLSPRTFTGLAELKARAYQYWRRESDRRAALDAARKALLMDPLRAEAWLWIAAVEQSAIRQGDAQAAPRAREAWAKALALDANLTRTARGLRMP